MSKFVLFAILGVAFYVITKTRWIVPSAVGCWLYFRGFTLSQFLIPLIIGAAIYQYFVKVVANSWASIAWSVSPSAWKAASRRPAMIRSTLRANWTALVFSNPLELYCVTFVAGLALWSRHGPGWGETILANLGTALAFTFLTFVIRITIVGCQSHASARCNFLLLRRFDPEVSFGIRSGVEPVLTAYGSIRTVSDESILNKASSPINPEDVPTGELQTLLVGVDWQREVAALMKTADVIVIDVTSVSRSVGWEIVQACNSDCARPIILIGQVQWLMCEHEKVLSLVTDAMQEYTDGGDAMQILSSLERPLPYADDLSNVVFAYLWYRRLRLLLASCNSYTEPRGTTES